MCDMIFGLLRERVSQNGELVNISSSATLYDQFPLVCDVKSAVEGAQSKKLFLYRASFRPAVGNHRLICERKRDLQSCRESIDENSHSKYFHPPVNILPRECSSFINIDHFKYTWGVKEYLEKRVSVFQKQGLWWHSESTAVLNHLKDNNGKLCVNCKALQCKNVSDET